MRFGRNVFFLHALLDRKIDIQGFGPKPRPGPRPGPKLNRTSQTFYKGNSIRPFAKPISINFAF